MVDRKETELPQEAIDKLMQGVASGIEAWTEETTTQETTAQNADKNKFPTLQPETYSKKDIQKLIDEYNTYLNTAPSDVDKDKFNAEFEQTVIGGTKDVEDFASGLLSVDDEALEDMEKYIELFGKEWINGSYKLTPAAVKAIERIKNRRLEIQKQTEKKNIEKTATEKTNVAKIKELMKKKPQNRSLQDYLFLKEAIENNPHRSAAQKKKDIESLTSQARLRMKSPKDIKPQELTDVYAFINAFGYDKDHAINKEARRFKDAIDKRMATEKTTDNNLVISATKQEKSHIQNNKEKKKDKEKKKGFFSRIKDKVKKGLKRLAPFFAVGLIASPIFSGYGSNKENKSDDNDNKNKIENIVTSQIDSEKTIYGGSLPELVVTGIDRSKLNLGTLAQYAKRIGYQEKLSSKEATKRAIEDLTAFKNLPNEIKAKFSGQTDEEKLAKLGVVRGDQDKLHKPIDDLIKGEKINPLTLKDISERTALVTSDFGANKDNRLKKDKQTIELSAYQIKKALDSHELS